LCDRLEQAQAPGRVVFEAAQVLRQLDQDRLGHVLRIGALQSPAAAPGEQKWAVALHELGPGRRVVRFLPQPQQQASAGTQVGVFPHIQYSEPVRDLTPIPCVPHVK
jgi:hypothetical protein